MGTPTTQTITHIEDLADENRARHLLEDTYNEVISWMHSARLEHGIGGDTQAASEHTQKAHDALTRAIHLESLLIAYWDAQEVMEPCS